MKRPVLIAVLCLAAATAAVAASARTTKAPSPERCGGQLWRMKTLSDAARKSVVLTPKTTTIGAIGDRPFPRPVPRKRRTSFQRQNWELVAVITLFRLEDAGLRLILFDARDHGAYANVVIPTPACLSAASRARGSMMAAWNAFETSCGRGTREWQPLGAVAHVSGIGFWSQRDGDRGAAPNGAELYPVTSFRIVVGCG